MNNLYKIFFILLLIIASFNARADIKLIAGITPLMQAVGNNDIEGVDFFCKSSPQVINKINLGGATALHISARNRNIIIMEKLLKCNANPNVKDIEGWTPIMRAASFSDELAIKKLIQYGSKLNSRNNNNESLMNIAVKSNCIKCIDTIIDQGLKLGLSNTMLLKKDINDSFIIAKKSHRIAIKNHLSEKLDMINEVQNKPKIYKTKNIVSNNIKTTSSPKTLIANREQINRFSKDGIIVRDLGKNEPFDITIKKDNKKVAQPIIKNNKIINESNIKKYKINDSKNTKHAKKPVNSSNYKYSLIATKKLDSKLKTKNIPNLNIKRDNKNNIVKKYNYTPVKINDIRPRLKSNNIPSLVIKKDDVDNNLANENNAKYKYTPVNVALDSDKLKYQHVTPLNIKTNPKNISYKYTPVKISGDNSYLEYNSIEPISIKRNNNIESKNLKYNYTPVNIPSPSSKFSNNISPINFKKNNNNNIKTQSTIKTTTKYDVIEKLLPDIANDKISLPISNKSNILNIDTDSSKEIMKYNSANQPSLKKITKNKKYNFNSIKKNQDTNNNKLKKLSEILEVKKISNISYPLANNKDNKSLVSKAESKKLSKKFKFIKITKKQKDNSDQNIAKNNKGDNIIVPVKNKKDINYKDISNDNNSANTTKPNNKKVKKHRDNNLKDNKVKAISDNKNSKKYNFTPMVPNNLNIINKDNDARVIKKFNFTPRKDIKKNISKNDAILTIKNNIFKDANDSNDLNFMDDPEFQNWVNTPKPEIKKLQKNYNFKSE